MLRRIIQRQRGCRIDSSNAIDPYGVWNYLCTYTVRKINERWDMKKIAFIFMIAISLAGGAVAALSSPSYAQVYEYPPPPPEPYASPWVGPDTPWVYYNGDWFLNGILYYFFGPTYGWAPYYSYAPGYIVRPKTWYGSKWSSWYKGRPQVRQSFVKQYPHYSQHQQGKIYSQKFYEQHHSGQGGGWQKGFQGHPAAAPHHEGH